MDDQHRLGGEPSVKRERDMTSRFTVTPKQLIETPITAVASRLLDNGTLFLDFGKAAFGTLHVPVTSVARQTNRVVHLGEKLDAEGRIDRSPPRTVRYCRIKQEVPAGKDFCRLVIPSDERNTGPAAIKMPATIGEVTPFRYAEIEAARNITAAGVRQIRVHYPFDDGAAYFASSDTTLNTVWNLCKYSIKATTFCGIYVDGDRERIPYEGDAYINQLSHYCVDSEYILARYTHEYLIQHPTWPTEWQSHSVMMAWQDYQYSGKTESLTAFYNDLCVKTLIDLARDDGLISTESERCTEAFEQRLHLFDPERADNHRLKDLVDWPPSAFTDGGTGERDSHEMRPVNTVVNAFHYHTLVLIARIAERLGKVNDHARFATQAEQVKSSINTLLFDKKRNVYVDGEGSTHASLHSNMFALAFDIVPPERCAGVVDFVKSRGMACSVYGAQYLLEALYKNNEDTYALELMTAQHDRSWWNMLASGSTITLEAWDWKYKNNLDWNHAWGAAPANIIPRYLMGIRPLTPGFRKVLIQPRTGTLTHAEVKHPTPLGPVSVHFKRSPDQHITLDIVLPEGMTAHVALPCKDNDTSNLTLDNAPYSAAIEDNCMVIDELPAGQHRIVQHCASIVR